MVSSRRRGGLFLGGGKGGEAYVDAFARHVFVIFARVGALGAFFADDAELFGGEDGLPF